jgi:hypothetical protein
MHILMLFDGPLILLILYILIFMFLEADMKTKGSEPNASKFSDFNLP